jgi:3-methyladenine DNA glycosylase AlkD
MWLRRTAILAQVRFRDETDLTLLEDCIAPSIARKEFWLRKAIGWALRSYAYTDMAWVKRYVAAHPELSGLSKREALKHA